MTMNHETDVSHAFKDGVNATLIDDPKNEVARFFNEVNCKFCGAELYAFPCQNDETTYWRCGTDHTDERGFERSWSCYEKELTASKAEVARLRERMQEAETLIKRGHYGWKKAEAEVARLREDNQKIREICDRAIEILELSGTWMLSRWRRDVDKLCAEYEALKKNQK
jgi:hypothetical protein